MVLTIYVPDDVKRYIFVCMYIWIDMLTYWSHIQDLWKAEEHSGKGEFRSNSGVHLYFIHLYKEKCKQTFSVLQCSIVTSWGWWHIQKQPVSTNWWLKYLNKDLTSTWDLFIHNILCILFIKIHVWVFMKEWCDNHVYVCCMQIFKIIIKFCCMCETCRTWLNFLTFHLLRIEKGDLKIDALIQVEHPHVWQPGGTSFTKTWDRQDQFERGGRGCTEAEREGEGDLLSHV